MPGLGHLRHVIRETHHRPEADVVADLIERLGDDPDRLGAISKEAAQLVRAIRSGSRPGLMEVLLAEYGLSTDEGVALMCLAEALLRVPDAPTIDALIEDKIAPSAWGEHLGHSSSPLVNASTWALLITGKVLQDGTGVAAALKNAVKRLGEPVIRAAVGRAMKELGAQFVLGETIDAAVRRGERSVAQGYSYSYDMLGEAALTASDADTYFGAYERAIARLASACHSADVRENPGISIKLSALHPRYETAQGQRVMDELAPRTLDLALQARGAGMGLNIDAEEADRLDLSLDVIEAVLSDPRLSGWNGFGVVVQAYAKRAIPVIDWLYSLAEAHGRRIMVRLVKGAYWDTEIKRAQVEGLDGFPVFTRKAATDVSYMACAQKLLGMTDRIYPQFATHNAHTVAAVLNMSQDRDGFEFQRLHGMGERLHEIVRTRHKTRCRIYAPVGAHRDLLAYLVRRLLENGANSSFVNQIVDEDVPPEAIAADPLSGLHAAGRESGVRLPRDIYAPERQNAAGWDLGDPADVARFDLARAPFATAQWEAGPQIASAAHADAVQTVVNPANPDDTVGRVAHASMMNVEAALAAATPWEVAPEARAAVLRQAADAYEAAHGEFFALLAREAGKSPRDAVAELREAVDFLRYYAARAGEISAPPCGVFTCISPWNFPLAIFTGQIAAALAAGNGVVAKPAEQTSLVAALAVRLLLEAGVPATALQLLPGDGATVGAALTSDQRVAGVAFTGSTETALAIHQSMARSLSPSAPLIAETGGLNAMVVDSTALPEQAVGDILASAFQSAGQRCSALRVLYVQEDVSERLLAMLYGAMDELRVGDPWEHASDVGPVIDDAARGQITAYIEAARAEGRVLKELRAPAHGTFVAPAVVAVSGIEDLEREVFGPVLHVATYRAEDLDDVVAKVNASGYGLTFGMHSRIDDRVEQVASQLNVGNIYINRNQIGAIVGSQPFGGEGLSGTGPKAGGPSYVARFTREEIACFAAPEDGPAASPELVQRTLDAARRPENTPLSRTEMPGPTGESNVLTLHGRGVILCLGPSREAAEEQAQLVLSSGACPVCVAPGVTGPQSVDGKLEPSALETLRGFDGVVSWGDTDAARAYRSALARRSGPILPLMTEFAFGHRCQLERHLCIDTTAAGGNAALLAETS